MKDKPRISRILVAMDSFKGTMTSAEACAAVAAGLDQFACRIDRCPLADGGSGTVSAVIQAMGGEIRTARVTSPLGNKIDADWGITDKGSIAVIEMAAPSGLALVPPPLRNPMKTTSFGVGELIAIAMAEGCSRIILGIGDTATVDGGLGAAQALGVRFFDNEGNEMDGPLCGEDLIRIASIEAGNPTLGVEVEVLCDVNNPLLGKDGAAAVFGPQKGATPEMVEQLEAGLRSVYQMVEKVCGVMVMEVPGAGAAGGMGACALSLLGGQLVPGTSRLLELQRFDEKVANADLLITGEGRMDSQSLRGKGAGEAVRRAKQRNIPVLVIAGLPPEDKGVMEQLGIDHFTAMKEPGDTIPTPGEAKGLLQDAVREWTKKLLN